MSSVETPHVVQKLAQGLAQGLADIHATAFPAPWSASVFADLLGQAGVFVQALDGGFILMRAVAGEAEILTLAVRPDRCREGLGRRLVEQAAKGAAERDAEQMFLEVAVDNGAAIGLYEACGFEVAGRRRGYYQNADGSRTDALIMTRIII